MLKRLQNWAVLCLLTAPITQAADVSAASEGLAAAAILSTLVYGLIGLSLFVVGYLLFDKLLKLDLRKELVIDQNSAIGVMMAGVFIGIGIIIAAAMR
ncbi:MAG: putative membrane protein [Rhodothermales bacterium]|jgi:putative membrane protein